MDQIAPLMQIGAQFSIYASDYEVTFVGRDGIRVNAVSGGNSKQLSFASVEELVENRAIQVNFTPAAGMEGSRAGLTEAQCDCLNRKIIYVRAVHKNAQHPGSQRAIAPVIQSAAKELNDQHPPGVSTVAGWVKKWVSGGCCDAALMPALKGSRARRLGSDPLERIITEAIQDVYLTSQRNPITAVRAQVAIAIAEYNRAADEPLTEPSYEYLRRIIQRIDHYKRDLARHGRHYAKRRHRAAGVSTVTTEPLELVEADGQMVDAVVCEKNEDGTIGREIGRAYVTVMLDVHDRCILSAYPSLAPFCGGTLLKTLSIACIADRDKPRGVPQKLIVDNGCDYQDSGFLRACNRIGVIVEPCGPREPNGKPHVERFFKTMSEDLIHKLPGTTFSNPEQRGDYDSQGMARLTMEDLAAHIETWIEQTYHRRLHRGINRNPISLWRECVQETPIRTLTPEEADIMLRTTVERTVVKGRIEVFGLQWKSHGLREFEIQQRALGRTPRVEVRIDELDLSTVYAVIHGPDGGMFKLNSCKPQYIQHLSLYEHCQLKDELKIQGIRDRLHEMEDIELYRLRCEYYAALGHKDDKIAARKRDRLRDAVAERRMQPLATAANDDQSNAGTKFIPSDASPTESGQPIGSKPRRSRKKSSPDSPKTQPVPPKEQDVTETNEASQPYPEVAPVDPGDPKPRPFRFTRQSIKRTPR